LSTIEITSGFDDNFCPVASVMIKSLANAANEKNKYNIHILHEDITEHSKIMLTETIREFDNVNISFINLSINDEINSHDFYESRHVNKASYYRLFLSIILPDLDKVLYLDPDTVILSDVAELFNMRMKATIVGVKEVDFSNLDYVKTHPTRDKEHFGDIPSLYEYFQSYLGFQDSDVEKYINAGVLLMDLKKIRITYYDKITETIGKNIFLFHDQDIINYIFKDDKEIADCKWNFPNKLYTKRVCDNKEISILHAYSTDHGKPWTSTKTSGAYLFWRTLRETPFYEILLHSNLGINKFQDGDWRSHINAINTSIKKINTRTSDIKNQISSLKLWIKIHKHLGRMLKRLKR